MEQEKYFDEEEVILLPPYWLVQYVDDDGHKHIATIKDKGYLSYLTERFDIKEVKVVEA